MHLTDAIDLMSENFEDSELWPSDVKIWYLLTWVLISGLIGIIAFPVGMAAIGFTADGVAGLSMAACCQSWIYGAFTGSDLK